MTISPPQAPAAIVPAFTYGDRLRKAREVAGLERAELAEQLGIHRQSISRYESDQSEPVMPVVVMWAWLTQVDLGWIQTGECTPRDSNSEPTGLESKKFKRRSAWIFDDLLDSKLTQLRSKPDGLASDASGIAAELGFAS